MLVAAALCPAPPVLVPEVSRGASPELDDVRAACGLALAELAAQPAARLLVVAGGPTTREHSPHAPGGWQRLGLDVDVAPLTGPPADGDRLPLALTVGRWLLARPPSAGPTTRPTTGRPTTTWPTTTWPTTTWHTVDVAGAARWGAAVAADPEPAVLLVLGESCAALGADAPLPADDAAAGYHADVLDAVARGDAPALLARQDDLATRLGASGRAPWAALAAAVGDRPVRARLLAHAAPYGVGYLVASWVLG